MQCKFYPENYITPWDNLFFWSALAQWINNMQVITLKKTLPCQLVGFLDSTMQSGLCSLVGAYQRNNIIHDSNKICHTWTHDNWFHDLYCTMWNLPESFPSPASTASPWTSNGVLHLGSLHKVHIIERNKEPKHKKHWQNVMYTTSCWTKQGLMHHHRSSFAFLPGSWSF